MENIVEKLNLKSVSLEDLKKENTAVIVVDMVVGFVEEGLLSSPRVKKMSEKLIDLNNKTLGYNKLFFVDSHNKNAEEFNAYPEHCLEGTREEELVEGLKISAEKEEQVHVVKKNSTNGFHVKEFKIWLNDIIKCTDNFIIVGCVTDICVLQFALTLKTYFNQENLRKKIIVPADCVETFDLPGHNADEMNLFALANMKSNGIEVVSEIL